MLRGGGGRDRFAESTEEKPTCIAPEGIAYRLARELALPKLSVEVAALFVGDAASASEALHHTTSHQHMHEINILFTRFSIEQGSSPKDQVHTIPSRSPGAKQAVPTLIGVDVSQTTRQCRICSRTTAEKGGHMYSSRSCTPVCQQAI